MIVGHIYGNIEKWAIGLTLKSKCKKGEVNMNMKASNGVLSMAGNTFF